MCVVVPPNQDRWSLWLEVLMWVAKLHELTRHGSHRAVDAFQCWHWSVLVWWRPFKSFDSGASLMVLLGWAMNWFETRLLAKTDRETTTRIGMAKARCMILKYISCIMVKFCGRSKSWWLSSMLTIMVWESDFSCLYNHCGILQG